MCRDLFCHETNHTDNRNLIQTMIQKLHIGTTLAALFLLFLL